jgi:hypothetical protein
MQVCPQQVYNKLLVGKINNTAGSSSSGSIKSEFQSTDVGRFARFEYTVLNMLKASGRQM